jgi:hypothetical protein
MWNGFRVSGSAEGWIRPKPCGGFGFQVKNHSAQRSSAAEPYPKEKKKWHHEAHEDHEAKNIFSASM